MTSPPSISSMPPVPPNHILVVGFDPSLRNWGIARAHLDMTTLQLKHIELDVINAELPTGKQVRQNSKDLESSYQIGKASLTAVTGAQAVFVEVPVGSQSARAMASYGICIGILGTLRAQGMPFFEVTPTEVKLATGQKKTASKEDMINWAVKTYPDANWPTYRRAGEDLVSSTKAEHMADAIAVIHAGINTQAFQQLLMFSKTSSALNAHNASTVVQP